MGQKLPDALVGLLREMRAGGISLSGLHEATGLSRDTLVRYTSPDKPPERKWTPEAEALLHELYPVGTDTDEIARRVNELLGRTDITAKAVLVRVGQLKILRNSLDGKAKKISEFWRKRRLTSAGLTDHE